MVTKKNIYHYAIYVIFALIFFCSIGLHSVSLTDSTGGSVMLSVLFKYAIVFIVAALIILIYKILFPKLPEKITSFQIPAIPKVFEIVGLVLVVLIMIFLRIMIITSKLGADINNIFYEYGLGNTTKLPDTTFASYLYALICRLLLKIHPSVYPLYIFSTLIHIGTAVLSYYMVKRALRMRYAILSTLLIAFMPKMLSSVEEIKPDLLITFLFVAYFYFLVRVNELNVKQKIAETYHLLFFVGLGVAAGFISSLDIIGVSLLIVSVSALLLIHNPDPWNKVQNRFIQALVFFASYAASLFGFLYVIPNNGMKNFENVFNYIYSFVPDGLSLSFIPPMEGRIEGIVLFIFAAIAIFAFIRNESDKGLVYCIVADFAVSFTFVNFNRISYGFLINYVFILICVIGLFSVPTFIISPEEEYEREMEKRKREEKKRKKEYEKDLASGNAGLSLNNSDYMGNKEPSVEIADNKSKEVAAAPEIPSHLRQRPPISIGYDKKRVVKNTNKPVGTAFETSENDNEKNVVIGAQTEEVKAVETAKTETPVTENITVKAPLYAENVSKTAVTDTNIDDTKAENVESSVSLVLETQVSETEENVEQSETYDNFGSFVSNPVYPDITTQPEPAKQSKVIPSRRDYKTAHVYNNAEEEKQHDIKMAETDANVNNQDAALKASPMIKNPLPGPKPHIAKELTFDYDLKDDELDFDITDLKGKDYYDI